MGKEKADQQTKILVAVGLILALLLYFVYARPSYSLRERAQENLADKEDALVVVEDELNKFLSNPNLVATLTAQLAEAEGRFPFYGVPDPTDDLVLTLPAVVDAALTAADVKYDTLPIPQKLGPESGAPTNTGAIQMPVQFQARLDQVADVTAELERRGLLATIHAIALREAPQPPANEVDFTQDGILKISITYRFWFSTVAPFGSAAPAPLPSATPLTDRTDLDTANPVPDTTADSSLAAEATQDAEQDADPS